MEDRNYDYVARQIEFAGLQGVDLNELQAKMESGVQKFTLDLQKKMGADEVKATLNFEQSKTGDFYFFNSFDLSLKKPGEDNWLTYKFRIQKGNSYTLTEGYNMLDGRSAYKSVLKPDRTNPENNVLQSGWSHLEFKDPQQDRSLILRRVFDYSLKKLDDQLQNIGILKPEERKKISDGLCRGHLVGVSVPVAGKYENRILEASSRFKEVIVYDENMNILKQSAGQGRKQGVSEDITEPQQINQKQGQKNTGTTQKNQPPVRTKRTKGQKVGR